MLVSLLYCLIFLGLLNGSHHRTSIQGYKIQGQSIVFDDTLPSGNWYHILVRAKPFDSTKHKITRRTVESYPHPISIVTKIDGRKPYGIDGEMPATEIDTFLIEINGNSILIPKARYTDLFEPTLQYNNQRGPYGTGVNPYETPEGKLLKIELNFSDGAGFYHAVFTFDREKMIRRWIRNDY